MNGIHDMGGMQDMGPVRPEKNEPVFHARWEGRMFALDMAVDGDWPEGSRRYQGELIPPAEYLRMSYYQKWYTSLTELMVKYGLLTREELLSGKAAGRAKKTGNVMRGDEVAEMISAGWPSTVDVKVDPQFQAGSASARETSSRWVIRDCRATRAERSERLCRTMACSFFLTQTC